MIQDGGWSQHNGLLRRSIFSHCGHHHIQKLYQQHSVNIGGRNYDDGQQKILLGHPFTYI